MMTKTTPLPVKTTAEGRAYLDRMARTQKQTSRLVRLRNKLQVHFAKPSNIAIQFSYAIVK
jgi:hypothetical protein